MTENLAGLVAKWRKEGDETRGVGRRIHHQFADELEAKIATLEAAAPPSTAHVGHDFEQLVWRANDLLDRAKEAMECDPEADNVGGDCWTWIKQTEIWLEELNRGAALATPSPQAPPEQSNAFSPTSAREQSSATASENLSVGDIAMWLDDNLANEEGAPFERRTEVMEKAFRMVIEQAAEAGGIAAEAYIENLDDGQVIRAEKCAEKVEDAIRGLKLSVPAATQEQPAGSGAKLPSTTTDWRWMRLRGYLRQWLTPHQFEIAMDCLDKAERKEATDEQSRP